MSSSKIKRDPWRMGYVPIEPEQALKPFTVTGSGWWKVNPRKQGAHAPHDFTRVLLAEPDAYVRRLLRVLLSSPHVSLIEVETGAAAIDLLGLKSFDLVVLAIPEDDLSAIETIRWIRRMPAAWSDIPILGLAKEDETGNIELALNNGLTDWTLKPIRRSELSQKLTTLIPGMVEWAATKEGS